MDREANGYFAKGRTKTGGRKKGTPHKATLQAKEIMDKAGFNPLRRMMRLANTTQDENIKAQMYRELAKYYAPQLKAVEHSGTIHQEHNVYLHNAEARQRRIEDLLAKRGVVAPLSVVDAD